MTYMQEIFQFKKTFRDIEKFAKKGVHLNCVIEYFCMWWIIYLKYTYNALLA